MSMGGHQSAAALKDEWLTPRHVLDALGPFDLDPCAPQVRPWDTAARHYTVMDNGLVQPWSGMVLLTIDENDTISACRNDFLLHAQNHAQNAEWLSRLPLSISVPAPIDHSAFCHVAGSAWHKTMRSESAELGNSAQERDDSTRNPACSNAQNAAQPIQQHLSTSGLSQGAATGLHHGVESAPERKQEPAGRSSDPLLTENRKSSKNGSDTLNPNLGNKQNAQAHEFTTQSVGNEKQDSHSLGQMPTGWTVYPLSTIPARTADQQAIFTKTTSYQFHTLTVPELLSATWCQPAANATSQKGPSIRIHGLRTKLLSLGLIEPCGIFVGHYKPRVWLNPPYGLEAAQWLARCADHGNAMALIFARTETRMFFDHVWPKAQAVLFLEGRLYFHHVCGRRASANAGAPSVLVAYGSANAECLKSCTLAGRYLAL